VAEWHWEPVTDDLPDKLAPAAPLTLSAVRQVAGELTVRESMIFLDGWEFTGKPPLALADARHRLSPYLWLVHRLTVDPLSGPHDAEISDLYSVFVMWGGWGSNPRPADYEKHGPELRVRYLHRYHEAVPPIALIAPLARVARSTNRSTLYHGDHRIPSQNVTAAPADQRARD
jgi:hypothetical protein